MSLILKFKIFLAEHSKLYREYNRKRVDKLNKKLEEAGAGYRYAPYIMTEKTTLIQNSEIPIKKINTKYIQQDAEL